MRFLKLILSFSIITTALLGDYVVFKCKYSSSQTFRAISDCLVHGSLGFLSALLFFTHNIDVSLYASVCNILFCTFLSSLIDIDHAVAARSFYWKNMLNAKQRGFLHCTSLWLVITTACLVYSFIKKKLNIYILTFMIILAYASHHVRDANRRGLWFYPFGHTRPLNKWFYVLSLGILPNVLGLIYKMTEATLYKETQVYYDYSLVV